MSSFIWILISSIILTAISLIGGVGILLSRKKYSQYIIYLVSFSAGALLSGAIVHLLPEGFEKLEDSFLVSILVLGGIVLFYVFEQFIHWHHCHRGVQDHVHPVSYLILVADGVHNLIDGLAVGSAFIVDHRLGLATLVAVVAHEIPQELGDFGILLHSGWSIKRALIFNLLSSLTFFVGAIIIYFISRDFDVSHLLPVVAGSFIYIAAVDLLPQVNKMCGRKSRFIHFLSFVVGAGSLVALRIIFE